MNDYQYLYWTVKQRLCKRRRVDIVDTCKTIDQFRGLVARAVVSLSHHSDEV